MSLERVFGGLRDVTGRIDPAEHLRLEFRLNGPAVGADGIVHTSPAYVDDFNGANGNWEIDLECTDALVRVAGGTAFYIVNVVRRVPMGSSAFPTDRTGWLLRVPPGGGAFAELVRAPANAALIWSGPTPPSDPTQYVGWYKTDALPDEQNYFEWQE